LRGQKVALINRWPFKRSSIHMKFSMTGQVKGDLLIEVASWTGWTVIQSMKYLHWSIWLHLLSGLTVVKILGMSNRLKPYNRLLGLVSDRVLGRKFILFGLKKGTAGFNDTSVFFLSFHYFKVLYFNYNCKDSVEW
jgi:hypothetical protein